MKKINSISLVLLATIFCLSCKKDSTPSIEPYTVPTTYSFTNVNYSNQTILIAMADQLGAKINLTNTIPNTVITAQALTDMFNNTGNPFNDSAFNLNGSGLRLSDYFPAAAKTDMLNYFDSIEVYSQSSTAAAPGVAGVATSLASKKLLLSPNGIFYSQVVKKTIMGVLAYQIANVYLKDSVNSSADTAVTGHYWDEAFGFFGVPVDFPANTKGLKYLSSYSNQVNAGLNSNSSIMNAYLKGRAAVSHNDIAVKQQQAALLIASFDTLNAACIVQEMHETETNINNGDVVAAAGTLSEAIGFVRDLKYNTGKRVITDAQITQLLALFDSTSPNSPNLYNFAGGGLTADQIKAKTAAISKFIGNIYHFSDTQLALL